MRVVALILIALIAVLHGYIAWFEIFAWEARGPRIFPSLPPELFAQTVEIAANQGIYNAFLAAGLFWSVCIRNRDWQRNVALCFLLFVATAGIVGAMTITTRTLLIQTLPAAMAILLLMKPARRNQ